MAQLKPGETVSVPCEVRRGAFPDEYLVMIETSDGPISGFVARDQVYGIENEAGYIQGVVQEVTEETVAVRVRGSFFTTTGLAYLAAEWAKSNLQPIGHA